MSSCPRIGEPKGSKSTVPPRKYPLTQSFASEKIPERKIRMKLHHVR